ncbi:uncharacterized protein LOC132747385 isoform X1 [Ruditapes philippinarum]|uniref:uncharacterized protein LOC132747385 isoform X1 n=1 Tax=Ruditapes philippinarum TaxID=129788 RepID=UPI00295AE9A1|nr:uncharacterized protein LOC132747385 isoform X1 [Ruditapes philippinarum]
MSGNIESVFVCLAFTICFIGCIKDVTSLECYSCQSKNTANSCQATSSCGQNQVCMLRRTVNNQTQEIHYESKCEDKTDCDLELDRYKAILSALVGKKRAMMKQIVAGDVCLIQCCDQDLCNNGCVMSSNLSYTMTSNPFATTKMIPANQAPTNSLQNMTALTQSSSALTSLNIIFPTKPSKAISTDATPPKVPRLHL